MYPLLFQPTDIELFHVNSRMYEVPKCFVKFTGWTGEPIRETFGGKPLVEIDNQPMFAESKRSKKDSIRTTQTNWFAAAIQQGLHTDNFLIVQWDM